MAAITRSEQLTESRTIGSILDQSLESIEKALKVSAQKTHSVTTPLYNAGIQAHIAISSLQAVFTNKVTLKEEHADDATKTLINKVEDLVNIINNGKESELTTLIPSKVALITRNSPLSSSKEYPLLTDITTRSITSSTREVWLRGDFSLYTKEENENITFTLNGKKFCRTATSDEEMGFLIEAPTSSQGCSCITGELSVPNKASVYIGRPANLVYRTFHCVVHISTASLTADKSDKKNDT